MLFREWVKNTRLGKKQFDPKAFTQEACGSRMTDRHGNPAPIGQAGWSRYEVDDARLNFDVVVAIADALEVPREEALRAAGYPAPGETEFYAGGVRINPPEEAKQREHEELRRKVERLEETLQDLKRMLTFAF